MDLCQATVSGSWEGGGEEIKKKVVVKMQDSGRARLEGLTADREIPKCMSHRSAGLGRERAEPNRTVSPRCQPRGQPTAGKPVDLTWRGMRG